MKKEPANTLEDMAMRDFLVLKIIGKSYINAAMDHVLKKEKTPWQELKKKKLGLTKEDLIDYINKLGSYYVKSIKKQINDFIKKRKIVFNVQHVLLTISLKGNHYSIKFLLFVPPADHAWEIKRLIENFQDITGKSVTKIYDSEYIYYST